MPNSRALAETRTAGQWCPPWCAGQRRPQLTSAAGRRPSVTDPWVSQRGGLAAGQQERIAAALSSGLSPSRRGKSWRSPVRKQTRFAVNGRLAGDLVADLPFFRMKDGVPSGMQSVPADAVRANVLQADFVVILTGCLSYDKTCLG